MAWARRGALGAALITTGVVIYQALDPTAALAAVMLDAAIVPAGSVAVTGLPGQVFAQPSEGVACTPLTDEARFWITPGDPATVAAFLAAHPPSWLPKHGTGSLTGGDGGISYSVADAPPGKGFGAPSGLDFTVAALAVGMTGIRADAEVVPPNASCTNSGGSESSGGGRRSGLAGLARGRRSAWLSCPMRGTFAPVTW